MNSVPLPVSLCTAIVPPRLRITRRVIVSPMPMPLPGPLVVKKGLKILLRTDSGMPDPLSLTLRRN